MFVTRLCFLGLCLQGLHFRDTRNYLYVYDGKYGNKNNFWRKLKAVTYREQNLIQICNSFDLGLSDLTVEGTFSCFSYFSFVYSLICLFLLPFASILEV